MGETGDRARRRCKTQWYPHSTGGGDGGGGALRLFRLLRSVIATAVFCTVLIHVAVFAGLLVYVGVQAGAPDGILLMVADTFTSSREAYVEAWLGVAD